MFSRSSDEKVWWKCKKGHEWRAKINDRSKGTGCPICANRQILVGYNDLASQRPDLAKEWNYEKNGNLFPSQVTYGSNKKVWWKCSKGHEWEDSITHRKNGRGCPYCSHHRVLSGYNDLATIYPELVKEWNFEKNIKLLPSQFTSFSGKRVWWKCSKGHEWESSISNRVNNRNCPICANKKVLVGYNDLETVYPLLAKEWHPTKNGELKPSMVVLGSAKRVWWKCNKCGHEWQAVVEKRSKLGRGCPECAKAKRRKKKG